MSKVLPFLAAFITGGFTSVGAAHLVDPSTAAILGALMVGAVTEIARRVLPAPVSK